MMMFKQNVSIFFNAFFIILNLILQSYQQTLTTTKEINKQELSFCSEKHTMSNTLQTFWHDANANCELESKPLLHLYRQLLATSHAKGDQCSTLIKHQLRKKLIQVLATQLEESLVQKSIKTNRELKQDLKEMQETDVKVAQAIWERVINEVYLFVEPEEIIDEIIFFQEPEIQIVAMQILLNKYLYLNTQRSETFIPLLTFRIHSLLQHKSTSVSFIQSLNRSYRRLPKDLRFLYESLQQKIGLLNYHHFEYLYAPRDNGPDSERRLALTWSQTKNSTDSDGHLLANFNDKGLLAIGNRFGASLKYLYVDEEHQAVYFWIGSGFKSSQWWQVLWVHESFFTEVSGYILLQNNQTKELLCATMEYDENRRYVTLLSAEKNMENPKCFWLVTRF